MNTHTDSKVILVTGASTGFGRDTAETLAHAGHRVFASMRGIDGKNSAHAEALRSLADAKALDLSVVELDVTDDASVNHAIAHVLESAGRLDVLINNAGIASAGVSEAFTAEQFAALLDVNVVGLHRVARAALPALRAHRSGLLINVGSILGRVTFPFFSLYGASKFAVEALSDGYRYELSQAGVDVALVQPGAYPTPMYASAQQPQDLSRAEDYGAVAGIPGAMFAHFNSVFSAEDAPDPHDVALAIQALVDAPQGQRAKRTIAGSPFGADTINLSTAPMQAEIVKGLGLAHLDTTNT